MSQDLSPGSCRIWMPVSQGLAPKVPPLLATPWGELPMVFSLPRSPKGHYKNRFFYPTQCISSPVLSLKGCVWNGTHFLVLQSYKWVSEEWEHPADSQGRALWDTKIAGFTLNTLAHHLFSCAQLLGHVIHLDLHKPAWKRKKCL